MKPQEMRSEAAIAALARVAEVCLDREGLTIQKYRVLTHINWGPASTSELADRLQVRVPVVTRIVDGLVEQGLVERTLDDDDRRRKHLTLTRAGESAVKRAELRIRKTMDHVAQSMSNSERQRAEEGLVLWGSAMRKYLQLAPDDRVRKVRETIRLRSTA